MFIGLKLKLREAALSITEHKMSVTELPLVLIDCFVSPLVSPVQLVVDPEKRCSHAVVLCIQLLCKKVIIAAKLGLR